MVDMFSQFSGETRAEHLSLSKGQVSLVLLKSVLYEEYLFVAEDLFS